jgi:hypothetical protein
VASEFADLSARLEIQSQGSLSALVVRDIE